MIKKYLPIIAVSFLGSVGGMFVFYEYFNPVKKIYIEQEQKAIQVAKNEILFSESLNNSFRSSSPTNFITAAAKSREAVVFIRSRREINEAGYNNTYGAASGSGVLISEDGYIVTNNHVIENASEVEVMMNDNKEFEAKVIGSDASTDLALIKIDAKDLPFLVFGNSDSLAIGEWVMAVGNPFRLQSTVTAGIVSAKARNINILENYGVEAFIQTDAAVNPGNSGGALVNTFGELVGINAAIMTQSGNYEGFSFAIPSNLARKVVKDFKEFGAVQRGWLGVVISNLTDDKATLLGLTEVEGVQIDVVSDGGGAQKGGLKSGDVMIEINGVKTSTMPVFMEQIARFRPGDKIFIKYLRNRQSEIAEIILRNQLNTTEFIAVRKDKILQDLGFEVRDLDSSEKDRLGKGVYVVSIKSNSKIDLTNMDPGYIIAKANDKTIENVDELVKFLKDHKGEIVLEGYYENYPGEYPYTFYLE